MAHAAALLSRRPGSIGGRNAKIDVACHAAMVSATAPLRAILESCTSVELADTRSYEVIALFMSAASALSDHAGVATLSVLWTCTPLHSRLDRKAVMRVLQTALYTAESQRIKTPVALQGLLWLLDAVGRELGHWHAWTQAWCGAPRVVRTLLLQARCAADMTGDVVTTMVGTAASADDLCALDQALGRDRVSKAIRRCNLALIRTAFDAMYIAHHNQPLKGAHAMLRRVHLAGPRACVWLP